MANITMDQTASQSVLRIGGTLALPNVLRSLGANPAELLAEIGLDLALFDDPNNVISYATRDELLFRCVARTGCQHLGLLVGQQAGLHSLGLLGLLARYSPDVGTALRNLTRFLHLHVRGVVLGIEVIGQSVYLSYNIYHPGSKATDQVSDAALACISNIMRTLCGHLWKPTEVRFAHHQPKDISPYSQFFKAPLVFGAEQNALVFASSWLDRRLSEADPELHRLLQKQIDTLQTKHEGDFPELVRSVLRTAILAGYANSDQVASLFSIHHRTLSRRLKDFGTSFRELLDDMRFEIARQMLKDTAMEVGQIAAALDYADASAFTRAFRRWSGTTPGQWRTDQTRHLLPTESSR